MLQGVGGGAGLVVVAVVGVWMVQEGNVVGLELLLYPRMDEATASFTPQHIDPLDVLGPVDLVGRCRTLT